MPNLSCPTCGGTIPATYGTHKCPPLVVKRGLLRALWADLTRVPGDPLRRGQK